MIGGKSIKMGGCKTPFDKRKLGKTETINWGWAEKQRIEMCGDDFLWRWDRPSGVPH